MIEASRFVTIEAESRSQSPSLRIDIDSVPTILTTFYHCNYAATWDMVKCFICTTILWQSIIEQQSSSRSTALLSPPIRNPSSSQTPPAPSHRYKRRYVCLYINCGHYSRLGDIKMFERLYNYVWCTFHMVLSPFHRHPPRMIKHSLHQPCWRLTCQKHTSLLAVCPAPCSG